MAKEYRRINVSTDKTLAGITFSTRALYSQLVDGSFKQIEDLDTLMEYVNHGVIIYWRVNNEEEFGYLVYCL